MKKKIGRPFGSKNKPKDTAKTDKKGLRRLKQPTHYADGYIDGFIAALTHARENPRTIGIDTWQHW